MNYTIKIKRMPPDELAHFGIKGQKWGVRRFENKDGTLTEEGKARYYSNPERKKVADTVKEYDRINIIKKTPQNVYAYDYSAKKKRDKIEERISKHPAVREIATKLSSLAKEQKDASDKLDEEENAFWSNKQLYEKYLNKAVDAAMKEDWSKNWGGRKNIYDWYKYDDGDQGVNSSIEIYKRSPEGKKLRDAEKAYWDSSKKFSDTCKSYVSEYLGNYGNDVLSKTDYFTSTVGSRLSSIVNGLARKHADFGSLDHSDILQHFGIKGQKWGVRRFENPDGTLTEEGQRRYYGKRFEKESRKQQRLNYKADQKKQIRLAEEHKQNAKKNAAIGLAGAATAGVGYLATNIVDGLTVQKISTYDAATGKKFSYIQDAWKLVPGVAGGFGMSVGALTAAVGLGKAAYHGIMAGVASHRASIAGHSKAAKKAKEHLDGMRTMFENTRYSDMVEKRFGGND